MKTIKMIPFGMPLIGEEERQKVLEVLKGPILVHGPLAGEFEEAFCKFTGAPHAVSTSSCTAALHLAYFYLGIGPGDEVLVPAETHVATAHAVELTGAKPVFVDAEAETGNMDCDQIESKITPRTRALSVVHYLGMPINMKRVCEIASRRGLFVVEDCALAIGTRLDGIHAGLYGDVGCFSFYPVKHMTTAEGGMLITKHPETAQKIARQKAFGVDRHMGERTIPGVYDVTMLGFNYRMSEIHAALGLVQLKRLAGFLDKRKQNYEFLSTLLREIPEVTLFRSSHEGYQSSYYCHSVLLDARLAAKRAEIIEWMKAKGVGTSVYYPSPVPRFRYYREKYGYREPDYPVAARISDHSIALPVGPHLGPEDMKTIAATLKEALDAVKRSS